MIAQKLLSKHEESGKNQSLSSPQFNVENFIENMTDWMFKIILFVGIPYFIIILIQFLRMS